MLTDECKAKWNALLREVAVPFRQLADRNERANNVKDWGELLSNEQNDEECDATTAI